jgi:hypothetical protein
MSGEALLGLIGQTGTYTTTGPAINLASGAAVAGYRTAAAAATAGHLTNGQAVTLLIQTADFVSRAVWRATYDAPNSQWDRTSEVLLVGSAFANGAAVTVYVVDDQITTVDEISSGSATAGFVPVADGSGNTAWGSPPLPLYTPTISANAVALDLNSHRTSYHRVTLNAAINAGGITVSNVPSSGVVEITVELRQSGGPYTCPVEAWSGITGLAFDTGYYLYTTSTPTVVTLRSTDGGTSWRARCNVPASQTDAADYGSGSATDGQVLTADGAGGAAWEAPATSGTVTSVAISGSDGIQVDSGSPITSNGTIALGIDASTLLTHIGVESGATADQTAQEIATAIDADATAETTLKSALGLGSAAYTASTAYAAATHASAHQSGGGDAIKLDDLATPDDNTDLNASTARHGLVPKLSGTGTQYLSGLGTWTTPGGAESAGTGEVEILAPTFAGDGLTAVALDITSLAPVAGSLV